MILVWICFKIRGLFLAKKTSFSNVLILDLMGIGDVVCLTPFIQTLKESENFSNISACFNHIAVDLSKSLVPLDDYIYHKNYKTTIKQIRKAKYDLVIIPGWGLKHTIIGLLSGASLLGFLHDLSFSNKYINSFKLQSQGLKRVPRTNLWSDMGKLHLSQRANSILRYLNLKEVSNILDYPGEELRNTQENYAVFHCFADYEGRQWALDNFQELASVLLKLKLVEKIYLVGAKSDSEHYQMIATDKVINVAGNLSLLETRNLIHKAKFFVGNDSGPMHIATFSGVPTYALMGPNLPLISGTISSIGYNFFHKEKCCPCNQRYCPYDYKCIKAITLAEVTDKIIKDYQLYYAKN